MAHFISFHVEPSISRTVSSAHPYLFNFLCTILTGGELHVLELCLLWPIFLSVCLVPFMVHYRSFVSILTFWSFYIHLQLPSLLLQVFLPVNMGKVPGWWTNCFFFSSSTSYCLWHPLYSCSFLKNSLNLFRTLCTFPQPKLAACGPAVHMHEYLATMFFTFLNKLHKLSVQCPFYLKVYQHRLWIISFISSHFDAFLHNCIWFKCYSGTVYPYWNMKSMSLTRKYCMQVLCIVFLDDSALDANTGHYCICI